MSGSLWPVGSLSPVGALLGLAAGIGIALAWWRLPWRRRPVLRDRLVPYLQDAVPASRLLTAGTSPAATSAERLLGPVLSDLVQWLDRISGGPGSVRRRLDQLGPGRPVEQFRAEQVVWGAAGAGAGALLGTGSAVTGSGGAAARVAGLVLIGALLGVLGRDQVLTAQVRRREQRMLTEFPAVAELLALAVGAGEGAAGALERVARSCHGDLSEELRRTLADARAGASLVQALDRLAARTGLPVLARFVDGVTVAIERGTPLGEVLRAQAQDVRELSRRRLIETGGRREIAMMVPVVFLVLPVTVLFAVFPGLAVLELR